jgi:hypothetical protein
MLFFGAIMCYLEDLCQTMPFEEVWKCLEGNIRNWLHSLEDPTTKAAYRNFFDGSKQGHSGRRVRGDAAKT